MVPDLLKSQVEPPLRQPLIEEVPQKDDEMGIIQRKEKYDNKEEKQNERKDSPIYAFQMKTTSKAQEKAQKEKVSYPCRVPKVKQER